MGFSNGVEEYVRECVSVCGGWGWGVVGKLCKHRILHYFFHIILHVTNKPQSELLCHQKQICIINTIDTTVTSVMSPWLYVMSPWTSVRQ